MFNIKNKNFVFGIKQGFTLIELLVVITIVAILALAVFLNFQDENKKARNAIMLDTKTKIIDGFMNKLATSEIEGCANGMNEVVLSGSTSSVNSCYIQLKAGDSNTNEFLSQLGVSGKFMNYDNVDIPEFSYVKNTDNYEYSFQPFELTASANIPGLQETYALSNGKKRLFDTSFTNNGRIYVLNPILNNVTIGDLVQASNSGTLNALLTSKGLDQIVSTSSGVIKIDWNKPLTSTLLPKDTKDFVNIKIAKNLKQIFDSNSSLTQNQKETLITNSFLTGGTITNIDTNPIESFNNYIAFKYDPFLGDTTGNTTGTSSTNNPGNNNGGNQQLLGCSNNAMRTESVVINGMNYGIQVNAIPNLDHNGTYNYTEPRMINSGNLEILISYKCNNGTIEKVSSSISGSCNMPGMTYNSNNQSCEMGGGTPTGDCMAINGRMEPITINNNVVNLPFDIPILTNGQVYKSNYPTYHPIENGNLGIAKNYTCNSGTLLSGPTDNIFEGICSNGFTYNSTNQTCSNNQQSNFDNTIIGNLSFVKDGNNVYRKNVNDNTPGFGDLFINGGNGDIQFDSAMVLYYDGYVYYRYRDMNTNNNYVYKKSISSNDTGLGIEFINSGNENINLDVRNGMVLVKNGNLVFKMNGNGSIQRGIYKKAFNDTTNSIGDLIVSTNNDNNLNFESDVFYIDGQDKIVYTIRDSSVNRSNIYIQNITGANGGLGNILVDNVNGYNLNGNEILVRNNFVYYKVDNNSTQTQYIYKKDVNSGDTGYGDIFLQNEQAISGSNLQFDKWQRVIIGNYYIYKLDYWANGNAKIYRKDLNELFTGDGLGVELLSYSNNVRNIDLNINMLKIHGTTIVYNSNNMSSNINEIYSKDILNTTNGLGNLLVSAENWNDNNLSSSMSQSILIGNILYYKVQSNSSGNINKIYKKDIYSTETSFGELFIQGNENNNIMFDNFNMKIQDNYIYFPVDNWSINNRTVYKKSLTGNDTGYGDSFLTNYMMMPVLGLK